MMSITDLDTLFSSGRARDIADAFREIKRQSVNNTAAFASLLPKVLDLCKKRISTLPIEQTVALAQHVLDNYNDTDIAWPFVDTIVDRLAATKNLELANTLLSWGYCAYEPFGPAYCDGLRKGVALVEPCLELGKHDLAIRLLTRASEGFVFESDEQRQTADRLRQLRSRVGMTSHQSEPDFRR